MKVSKLLLRIHIRLLMLVKFLDNSLWSTAFCKTQLSSYGITFFQCSTISQPVFCVIDLTRHERMERHVSNNAMNIIVYTTITCTKVLINDISMRIYSVFHRGHCRNRLLLNSRINRTINMSRSYILRRCLKNCILLKAFLKPLNDSVKITSLVVSFELRA